MATARGAAREHPRRKFRAALPARAVALLAARASAARTPATTSATRDARLRRRSVGHHLHAIEHEPRWYAIDHQPAQRQAMLRQLQYLGIEAVQGGLQVLDAAHRGRPHERDYPE